MTGRQDDRVQGAGVLGSWAGSDVRILGGGEERMVCLSACLCSCPSDSSAFSPGMLEAACMATLIMRHSVIRKSVTCAVTQMCFRFLVFPLPAFVCFSGE